MCLLLIAPSLAAGLLTETEVFARVFSRFDTDGNGSISATEHAQFGSPEAFAVIDLDSSGAIDLAELTTWIKSTQPRPPPDQIHQAPGGHPRAEPHLQPGGGRHHVDTRQHPGGRLPPGAPPPGAPPPGQASQAQPSTGSEAPPVASRALYMGLLGVGLAAGGWLMLRARGRETRQ